MLIQFLFNLHVDDEMVQQIRSGVSNYRCSEVLIFGLAVLLVFDVSENI